MSSRSYRFADASRPGLVLGLTGRQLAPLIGGVLWLALTLQLNVPILGLPGPIIALGIAFGRWRGTPLAETLVPTLRLHTTARTGRQHWTRTPLLAPASTTTATDLFPPMLEGLAILETTHRTRADPTTTVAVVHDRRAGTVTAYLPARGHQFALAAPAEQDHLLARWGQALSPLARERSPIVRCTWHEWAHPIDDRTHRAFLTSLQPPSGDALDDYLTLIDHQAPATIAHQTLIGLTVDQRRTRPRTGTPPLAAAVEFLLDELDQLATRLETAELTVGTPLTPLELATAIRVRSDPTRNAQLDTLTQSLAAATGRAPLEWGPMTVEPAWTNVHVDGTRHRVYRIASWPPLPVAADWLGPLLTSTHVTRTVTVTLEPIPMSRAARAADREAMGREADADLKTRKGFRVSARDRKRLADVEARERELSEGHAEFRFVGLIDVAAPTLEALDDACRAIEQAAAQALVDLRPLEARHDLGWVASLPAGRTLPSRTTS